MSKIITAQEAAEILQVSRQRISQLLKAGKLISASGGITYNSVIEQKGKSKKGRPLGSFKY